MKSIRALRTLVIAEFALIVAGSLAVLIPQEPLPSAVEDYLQGPGAGPLFGLLQDEFTAFTYVVAGVLAVFVATYVAALIGLLLLRPWARRLYVLTYILGTCLYLFSGVSLLDPVAGTIDYLAAACSGAILALLYWSDARTCFEHRSGA